jgi:hypothetical protein
MVESSRQDDGGLNENGQKTLRKWFNDLCEPSLQQLGCQLAQGTLVQTRE